MTLNEHEKSQVQSIISDPRWGVVIKISDMFIEHIKQDNLIKDSEWDTIRATITQSAKIEGIKSFVQEVYKHAS